MLVASVRNLLFNIALLSPSPGAFRVQTLSNQVRIQQLQLQTS